MVCLNSNFGGTGLRASRNELRSKLRKGFHKEIQLVNILNGDKLGESTFKHRFNGIPRIDYHPKGYCCSNKISQRRRGFRRPFNVPLRAV